MSERKKEWFRVDQGILAALRRLGINKARIEAAVLAKKTRELLSECFPGGSFDIKPELEEERIKITILCRDRFLAQEIRLQSREIQKKACTECSLREEKTLFVVR